MKKILALLLSLCLLLSLTACTKDAIDSKKYITDDDAHTYLSEFFTGYNKLNNYLAKCKFSSPEGLPVEDILLGYYYANKISFSFTYPVRQSDNVYTSTVVVSSPDFRPVYENGYKYDIVATPDIDKAYSVFEGISRFSSSEDSMVEKTVSVTVRYKDGVWSVDPSTELALAIFPNIDKLV